MELLVILVGLSGFAVLAMRFGYDSRDGAPSEERNLAILGWRWDNAHSATDAAETAAA